MITRGGKLAWERTEKLYPAVDLVVKDMFRNPQTAQIACSQVLSLFDSAREMVPTRQHEIASSSDDWFRKTEGERVALAMVRLRIHRSGFCERNDLLYAHTLFTSGVLWSMIRQTHDLTSEWKVEHPLIRSCTCVHAILNGMQENGEAMDPVNVDNVQKFKSVVSRCMHRAMTTTQGAH